MKYSVKIFIAICIIVMGIGFGGFGYWLMREVRSLSSITVEDSLIDFSHILASNLSTHLDEDGYINTKHIEKTFLNFKNQKNSTSFHGLNKTPAPFNIYVTDDEGIVLFDSRLKSNKGKDFSQWNDVYLTLRGKYGARSSRIDPKDPKTSVYFVAAPIIGGGLIRGVVSVIKEEKSLSNLIRQSRKKILSMASFMLALAVIAALLFSYLLTRPIESLLTYVKDVSEGKNTRPPKTSSPELNKLGSALDEMRISLEGKKSVEHFVQHLTHELKSPLTAIRASAEILEDDPSAEKKHVFLQNIISESSRAKILLDRLLGLASLENKVTIEKKDQIRWLHLAQTTKNSLASLASQKQIDIQIVEKNDPGIFFGNKNLLTEALNALVMNAIEFSPHRGKIVISIETLLERIEIQIHDEGPGVPSYAADKIFDKFYSLERPDSGEKSSGLGLNYAKEIIALHGGSIDHFPSPPPQNGYNFLIFINI